MKISNRILSFALTGLVTVASSAVMIAAFVASPTMTPGAVAQEARYRLRFWYAIDQSNDGVGDNTVELYGEVRVNGQVVAGIPRNRAVSREAGQTLEMGSFTTNKESVVINASLTDRDGGSADDPVFKMGSQSLSLARLAGREKWFSWKSGGGEGATLHINVERLN
jgi:hypothetical protein